MLFCIKYKDFYFWNILSLTERQRKIGGHATIADGIKNEIGEIYFSGK